MVAILLCTALVPLEDKSDGALDAQQNEIKVKSFDVGKY